MKPTVSLYTWKSDPHKLLSGSLQIKMEKMWQPENKHDKYWSRDNCFEKFF